MKLKHLSYITFVVTTLAVNLPNSAEAYDLFRNREAWEAQIVNVHTVTEDFDVPNQFLIPRPC